MNVAWLKKIASKVGSVLNQCDRVSFGANSIVSQTGENLTL